jgi:hypothetical protein
MRTQNSRKSQRCATGWHRLPARRRRALDQQTATSEILRVISQSPTEVQPVFDAIVRSAVPLCDAMLGAVFRFDGELMHLAASHNYTPEALQALQDLPPLRPQEDNPRCQCPVANDHHDLGRLHQLLGKRPEAREHFPTPRRRYAARWDEVMARAGEDGESVSRGDKTQLARDSAGCGRRSLHWSAPRRGELLSPR